MPIALTCRCGREFQFEDKFGGQTIACPDCSTALVVPPAPPRPPQADPAFERDTFLINQKIRIDQKYAVTDEQGHPVLFVVRPTYLAKTIGAILGGLGAGGAVGGLLVMAGTAVGENTPVGTMLMLAGIFGGLAAFLGVAIALSPKRHTSVYHDESLGKALLVVEQDKKFQPIIATYTVRDDKGKVLARLRKNYLFNLIRKRWLMTGPDGREILTAMEDSIWKAALRRFLGPMLGLLRTNFILIDGGGDQIGEFNRKMTLLDKYVLDLTADPERNLDRRLALAVSVMLDTGERR